MALAPGTRLGPYEILGPLGAGGMGEVYRARHLKLDRDVAVKVLPDLLADDPERLARFEREARTASALNHPNVITIHDVAERDGITWIAMELVEGRTLRDILVDGPLPIDEVLRIAAQVTDGLARAHDAGVIHRDIKPANVMVAADGLVKILDFGIAKPLTTADGQAITAGRVTDGTREGTLLGTPGHMSPEQLRGEPVDHRSDQFALGILIYEMVIGEPPFDGPSLGAVIGAVLTREPPPMGRLRPDAPRDLQWIVGRCLRKNPDERFASTGDVLAALARCQRRLARARFLRRPVVWGPVAACALLVLGAGAMWAAGADARWAEKEAPREIADMIERGDLFEAYRTALEAQRLRPDHAELNRLLERITLPLPVRTEPEGARVMVAAYGAEDPEWHVLGTTPIDTRVPYAAMQWRLERDGYEPVEGAPFSPSSLRAFATGLVLDPVGTRPDGTVRIPAGGVEGPALIQPARFLAGTEVGTFHLDRLEVTNEEFARFVAAGGYRTPEWWPAPFERDGAEVPWSEAMQAFRDPTGRPGPSTWKLGGHPPDQASHPVRGVSWFEAAAYCAFRGRSLPTMYHWFRAIGQEQVSDILEHSNMDGEGPAPVGSYRGLAAYGAYDLAGNVKEWVWNATNGGMRYILGGAWNEPGYVFRHLPAADPWGREPTYGFRCAEYPGSPAEALTAPVDPPREYTRPDPVSDETFEVLRGAYAYDPDSLAARVERVDDSRPGYRRETVSIRTAYGDGRMDVHLLIPRGVEPPWQSVIWFPGDDVFGRRSSDHFASAWLFDWLPRLGRVVVYPVYRGMYERFEAWQHTPAVWRDMVVSWGRDVSRTIDYLETRPDFDPDAIGFYGFSGGALYGPVFAAVEPRISTTILLGGGLPPLPLLPEMNPVHFGPRTRTPTLMINGEDDFIMPYELSQLPFFELLGAPPEAKRHARLPGGHIPSDPRDIVREVSDWLDHRFGEVGGGRPAGR